MKVKMVGRDWISISNIADYCQVSMSTVRRWMDHGVLSAVTLPSGHRRVSVADFVGFLEKQKLPVPSDLLNSSRSL